MRITLPVGCGDAVVEAVACFFNSPKLGQSLGGHLVGGNVVVVVLDEGVELSECGIGAAFRLMSHRQSVAGKCVGGVLLKHLGEECDAIHMSMVRRDAWSWQAAAITLVGMSEEVLARTVCQSQSERSEIIFPSDANALGNLFGGRLMQYIDLVGAMAASRHARAITVTASMDHLDFVAPVHVGDLLILKASVNRAFRTSMEVGVKAMVEDVRQNRLRHVSSAYLTYVAVDMTGKRIIVPQVIPETEHQKRRYEDAGRRREMRAGETQRKKEIRAALGDEWHI